jgi:hypothetical protein
MKTASSNEKISFLEKISYAFKLFRKRLAGGYHVVGAWNDIDEYQAILQQYDDTHEGELTKHRVLEIGYGARPWRLFTLLSVGVDIIGIDLEQPTYGFNILRLLKVLRKNGFERFMKSSVRGLLFDRQDLRLLEGELRQRGKPLIICDKRLLVGNASDQHHFAPNSFTFIYSEDVFEHIPTSLLPDIVENMYCWMIPQAIALIRPHIFTGISGGHDPDYYQDRVQLKKVDPNRAWAHLWDSHYVVNTYLNRMRLSDYVALFEKRFEILAIKQKFDRLGLDYIDHIRKKVPSTFTEDELLTDEVLFILKSRKQKC